MRIGYGRVSTRDQNPEAQHDALRAAGCDEIFTEALDRADVLLQRHVQVEDQLVRVDLERVGEELGERLAELVELLSALLRDKHDRRVGLRVEVDDQDLVAFLGEHLRLGRSSASSTHPTRLGAIRCQP